MKICSSCGRQNPDDTTWCPECGTIPRAEKIKRALITPLAISPIMKWGALPGIVGMLLLMVGVLKKVGWLKANVALNLSGAWVEKVDYAGEPVKLVIQP